MAEFLTTNGISFYIEKIIKEAREELYILFPHLQLSRELYEILKDASDRGTHVVIVYTNEDLHTEQKLLMGELANLEVYQSENLNAKCCCSEGNILLTSMDMHQINPNDNIEMGILFTKAEEIDLYKKIYGEIKSVINSSKNMNLHKRPVEELVLAGIKTKKIYHGFCIKCAMPISYNIANPYCRSCMPKNNTSPEAEDSGNYCHLCGSQFYSEIKSPLCEACRTDNMQV
jgi:hypothetical protein